MLSFGCFTSVKRLAVKIVSEITYVERDVIPFLSPSCIVDALHMKISDGKLCASNKKTLINTIVFMHKLGAFNFMRSSL